MNIVQRPDSISLSGNMKPFVVSSATPVRFVLSIGGSQIIDETYHPDTNQNIYIDVKNVVIDRLSFELSDLAVYNQTGVIAAFSATFNGTNAYSFSVIRAGVDNFSDVATNFLKANFLTWQNQEKMVGYSQPEFLTYYAVVASKLKLKAYFSDNTNATVEISSLTASRAYTADLSYARISGRWTSKTLTYYDVWVEDTAGTRLTYVQRYIASAVKRLDEWFLFENSLGGIDTAVMGGDTDFAMQLESEMILTDDFASDDITAQDKTYNKNTGNLTYYERKWILDFFVSKRRYKVVNGQLRAISLMSSDVQATLSENLHAFNFTYIFANATSFLNLQRRDDLPAGIKISMPDNVAFIEPRLNELPRLALTDDVLFPVQSPYAEKFGTTTWGAIRDAVEKKIASEISKIPVPDIPETLPPSKHTHEISDTNQLKTELEKRLLKAVFDENFSVSDALVEVLKNWKINGDATVTGKFYALGGAAYSRDAIQLPLAAGGSEYLTDLLDVTITNPLVNQHLKYNGTNWVNASISYTDLTDKPTIPSVPSWALASTKPSYNWSEIGSKPASFPPSSHDHIISDVTDLKTELEKRLLKAVFDENFSVTDALVEVLKNWKVNGDATVTGKFYALGGAAYSRDAIQLPLAAGGSEYLTDLLDVTITNPLVNQHLKYNGTNWVNASISYTDLTDKPTIPSVPSWALASTKPSYNWSEIGSKPASLSSNTIFCIDDYMSFGNNDISGAINYIIANVANNSGCIIDCRSIGDVTTSQNITLSIPCTLLLGYSTITFTGTDNFINITADNVKIQGMGRASKDDDTANPATKITYNRNGNGIGYHIYARGRRSITLDSLELVGVRSSDGCQFGSTHPINGCGGIYIEKGNPGIVSSGNNVDNIQLSNLSIRGTGVHGIYIDTPILSFLRNVRISQAGGHGIFINGGTTVNLDSCYVSSANYAAFLMLGVVYCTFTNCAAEYSGIGYWIRSCRNVNMFSPGIESLNNMGANPWRHISTGKIGFQQKTLNSSGADVLIPDVGNDHVALFRGSGIVITGGSNIYIVSPYATNCGNSKVTVAYPAGTSTAVTTRFYLLDSCKNVILYNPGCKQGSGGVYAGRNDIEVKGTAANIDLTFDPYTDNIAPPGMSSSSSDKVSLYIQGSAQCFVHQGEQVFTDFKVDKDMIIQGKLFVTGGAAYSRDAIQLPLATGVQTYESPTNYTLEQQQEALLMMSAEITKLRDRLTELEKGGSNV